MIDYYNKKGLFMNKKFFLLSVCSLMVSNNYAMQPQQPIKPLTLQERKARAWSAYRACEKSYHMKCVEYYSKETEITDSDAKCIMTEHVDCWKVYKEKLTEGVYEEVKEYFDSKK